MKKVLFFIIIIASFFTIKNLLVSIYGLWQKQELIVQAQKELDQEREKNKTYKEKLSLIKSPQFIEGQVRDKLFMAKPNEQVVVISKSLLTASDSAVLSSKDTRPNWQKWWGLFFGG